MRFLLIICAAVLVLGTAAPASAEVEWDVVKTLPLEGNPLDMAVSAENRKIYVLMEGGKVGIFSSAGQLEETVTLDAPADRIALAPAGGLLYVSSGEDKTLQVVRLEFVQKISTAGSPVKGPANAPVTVAIFNDFQ